MRRAKLPEAKVRNEERERTRREELIPQYFVDRGEIQEEQSNREAGNVIDLQRKRETRNDANVIDLESRRNNSPILDDNE